MWIVYAIASALFAGCMSILAKIGIKNTDSNLATALRTIVVTIFAWLMVFVVGSQSGINNIDMKSLVFLVLSGLATGGSWLCYFRALQIGDVNKVVPVDKSSTILTMLLSFLLLGEDLSWLKAAAMILIGVGTYLMIERKMVFRSRNSPPAAVAPATSSLRRSAIPAERFLLNRRLRSNFLFNKKTVANPTGYKWLIFAVLSAVFASLTAILGKIGITGVESNLGTAIRTVVVLIMAWLIVFLQGKQYEIKKIDKRSWVFIGLSGLATGLSWLCFYRALQEGPASVVVPIDKLSILVTVAFGYFILNEKPNKKPLIGLVLIVIGTLSLLI
ncbi:MAG: EamA family transporter [Lachnospiraceae bacterium]